LKLLRNINKASGEGDQGGVEIGREVYAVTHEPFVGLGTGFISFLARRRGN